jgi:hypothetical protein
MFETLLSLITRAVVALEKLASAGDVAGAGTPATEAPAKATRTRTKAPEAPPTPPQTSGEDDFLNEPQAEPEVKYERADVKKALQDYGAKHGMPKAQELFKQVSGVSSLSDLPIEKFAEVIKATGITIKK